MPATAAPRLHPSLTLLGAALLLGAFSGCDEDSATTRDTTSVSYRSAYDYDLGVTGYAGRPTADRTGNDPLRYAYYGLPVSAPLAAQPQQLFNLGYAVGYDTSRHLPLWVAYRLSNHDHATAAGSESLAKAGITADPRLGPGQPTGDADHHDHAWLFLAPPHEILTSAGPDAAAESLLASNVLPCGEPPGWAELRASAQAYANANNELWVEAGPIFKDGPAGTTISAVWTIEVVVQKGVTVTQAFILPLSTDERSGRDRTVDLGADLTSIAAISAQTGLSFFPNLPDAGMRTRAMVIDQPPGAVWPSGTSQPVATRSAGRE